MPIAAATRQLGSVVFVAPIAGHNDVAGVFRGGLWRGDGRHAAEAGKGAEGEALTEELAAVLHVRSSWLPGLYHYLLEALLQGAAMFHGAGHGDFVSVLNVGAGGDAGGDAGDRERRASAMEFVS